MSGDELIKEVIEARSHAYGPYSKFSVGAARESAKLKGLLPRHNQGILESFQDV